MEKTNYFLLAAVNAKYIHSNLAVYSMTAYARERGMNAEFAEYTINHQMDAVLRDLYMRQPDVIGFSCYIWNMDFIKELAEELHKIMPHLPIWLGGPEVSWNPEERMEEMPFVTGIMIGEGEETFLELLSYYQQKPCEMDTEKIFGGTGSAGSLCGTGSDGMVGGTSSNTILCASNAEAILSLESVNGICFRDSQGEIKTTAPRKLLSMDAIPFPYADLDEYRNRIIYYESSRGCPFSCSYCLSSVDKKLRFRSLSRVFEELSYFLCEKTAQVKFVDRTFNCRHEHAYAIWNYIQEHDNGVTNFHFEIAADLLREEDFALFAKMRPGLIQLEIGVQTTNPKTLDAIGRKMDLQKVAEYTERVRKGKNIHQHLDLIAGLPWEDLESFAQSFNEVYAMKPNQLQLGFLKVLHGTRMEQEIAEYGLVYHTHPTYEVLYTKWISFSDLLELKNVEETVEEYYNSGQFSSILTYIVPFFETPFEFYRQFGAFLQEQGYRSISQNRVGRYMVLRHFLQEWVKNSSIAEKMESLQWIDELLSYDFCLREKLNRVPAFIPDQEPYKKQVSDFFAQEMQEGTWLGKDAKQFSYRQLRGRFQPLVFQHNILQLLENTAEDTKMTRFDAKIAQGSWLVLFDYENRNPMDHNAQTIFVDSRFAVGRVSISQERCLR